MNSRDYRVVPARVSHEYAVSSAPASGRTNVRAWEELLDQLDLAFIVGAYGSKGPPSYDPLGWSSSKSTAMSGGIESSRYLERSCWAGRLPDAGPEATAGPGRWPHGGVTALADLLQQSVRLAAAAGLVRLEAVAVDGTKTKVSASHRAMSDAHLQERRARWRRPTLLGAGCQVRVRTVD